MERLLLDVGNFGVAAAVGGAVLMLVFPRPDARHGRAGALVAVGLALTVFSYLRADDEHARSQIQRVALAAISLLIGLLGGLARRVSSHQD